MPLAVPPRTSPDSATPTSDLHAATPKSDLMTTKTTSWSHPVHSIREQDRDHVIVMVDVRRDLAVATSGKVRAGISAGTPVSFGRTPIVLFFLHTMSKDFIRTLMRSWNVGRHAKRVSLSVANFPHVIERVTGCCEWICSSYICKYAGAASLTLYHFHGEHAKNSRQVPQPMTLTQS